MSSPDSSPTPPVFRGELTAEQRLNGKTEDLPHQKAALEELLLLWLANSKSRSLTTDVASLPLIDVFQSTKGNIGTGVGLYISKVTVESTVDMSNSVPQPRQAEAARFSAYLFLIELTAVMHLRQDRSA